MIAGSASSKSIEKRFGVTTSTDAVFCSIQTKKIASDFGFDSRAQWALAIVVKELVTNAVIHAGGGTFTIRAWDGRQNGDGPKAGIEIEVEDGGPGIQDLSNAVLDGYSRGRFVDGENFDAKRESLGSGLGTVKRLMDSVNFVNKTAGGLLVIARKNLP